MKNSFINYFYLLILTVILPSISKADQLSVLPRNKAEKAAQFLAKQESIIKFCGCCENDSKDVYFVKNVYIEQFADTKDYQIIVEAISEGMEEIKGWIDLAYTHINKGGVAVCVALELGLDCDPCIKPFKWPSKSNMVNKNKLIIGTNSYYSTPTFSFNPTIDLDSKINRVEIKIGKKLDGGVIMIEIPNFQERLCDNLILYMVDGSVIECIDRNIRDIVDGNSSALYYLTFDDIEKIKKSNIEKIRYSINHSYLGKINLTATNNDDEISIFVKVLF
jgi:hypothetical protein